MLGEGWAFGGAFPTPQVSRLNPDLSAVKPTQFSHLYTHYYFKNLSNLFHSTISTTAFALHFSTPVLMQVHLIQMLFSVFSLLHRHMTPPADTSWFWRAFIALCQYLFLFFNNWIASKISASTILLLFFPVIFLSWQAGNGIHSKSFQNKVVWIMKWYFQWH